MNLKLSIEDALILKSVLEEPKMLEAFNDLVRIYIDNEHCTDSEARSLLFPMFAEAAIKAVKDKKES